MEIPAASAMATRAGAGESPASSRGGWWALALLLAGLLVTALLFHFERGEEDLAAKRDFEFACKAIQTTIENRLAAHARILRSGAAFFADDDGVNRKEWHEFYDRRKLGQQLPGIQGIGFALLIPPSQLAQHIEKIRAEGFPDYRVKPEGERDAYSSIIFLEPFSGRNLRAFGYDMFSEPIRRAAMERARDQDEPSLSGKVTLVQEIAEDVQAGTLMYVPVYRMGMPYGTVAERRAAIQGWVYSPYRMNDLMQGILDQWGLLDRGHIRLKVFDGEMSPAALLYDSQPVTAAEDAPKRQESQGFHRNGPPAHLPSQTSIDVAGRRWILSFAQSGGAKADFSYARLMLGGGTAITLLLSGLALSLINTRFHALRIAARVTADLRESEEIHASMLANISDIIGIVGSDGIIKYQSPNIEKWFGWHPDDLVGNDAWRTIHPDDLERVQKEFAAFLEIDQSVKTMECRYLCKDGGFKPIALTAKNLTKDPVISGVLLNYRDITVQKRTEDERNEALRRAEASAAAKSEFLGIMSHELRTPLNGVLGFAELLTFTSLDEKQKSYAQTIRKSGRHLLAIVNDILDFSSIESGKMSIEAEQLSLSDLVEFSAAAARLAAADKGIEFRCEVAASVPDQITGDARRIHQILINLLGNAVKFTADGSVVLRVARSGQGAWASRPCEAPATAAMPDSKRAGRQSSLEKNAAPTAPEGSFLEFSVEDTGIGISAGTLARLFDPFTQADATTTRRFGGTGLGLAITKRLAEAMGGSITVTSVLEKGSTFTFRFPLEVSAGGMASVPSQISDRERNKTALTEHRPPVQTGKSPVSPDGPLVLVVDDDQTSRELVEKMLQGLGYRLEFADNGEKALQAFLPGKFSAILMDMAMPVMDGMECTVRIRELEAAAESRVPIIAFTANVLPDDREKCLAAGMDDFLSKPFKRAELAAKLARACPNPCVETEDHGGPGDPAPPATDDAPAFHW